MTNGLDDKLEQLEEIIGAMQSVLVAYSGGVDSALVALIAHRELGAGALACIGVSPSYPQRELRDAIELAGRVGFAYRVGGTAGAGEWEHAGKHKKPRSFLQSGGLRSALGLAAPGRGRGVAG